jgi:hypothetical protein
MRVFMTWFSIGGLIVAAASGSSVWTAAMFVNLNIWLAVFAILPEPKHQGGEL